MELIKLELYSFADLIKVVYGYIFPEYPAAGIIIVALSLLLFVVYLFKTEFKQAVKVSFTVFAVLTFLLLVIHHLGKILHVSLLF